MYGSMATAPKIHCLLPDLSHPSPSLSSKFDPSHTSLPLLPHQEFIYSSILHFFIIAQGLKSVALGCLILPSHIPKGHPDHPACFTSKSMLFMQLSSKFQVIYFWFMAKFPPRILYFSELAESVADEPSSRQKKFLTSYISQVWSGLRNMLFPSGYKNQISQ